MIRRIAANVLMWVFLISTVCTAAVAQDDALFLIVPDEAVPRAGLFAPGMTVDELRAAAGQYPGATFDIQWLAPEYEQGVGGVSVTLQDSGGETMLEFLFAEGDFIVEKKLFVDDPKIVGVRVFDQRFETPCGLHAGMTLEQAAASGCSAGYFKALGSPAAPYAFFEQIPCVLLIPDTEVWTDTQADTVQQLNQQYDAIIPLAEMPGAAPVSSIILACEDW
jgi:hypothetical protein